MQVSELHFFSHHTGPPKLALSWQHCCTQAWKFTAVIAGCSLLILFNNSLAKSLKLAVKPTCREYALGSGSPPPPTLSQRSNCKYKDGSLQTARFSPTLLTCTSWVSRGGGGAQKTNHNQQPGIKPKSIYHYHMARKLMSLTGMKSKGGEPCSWNRGNIH